MTNTASSRETTDFSHSLRSTDPLLNADTITSDSSNSHINNNNTLAQQLPLIFDKKFFNLPLSSAHRNDFKNRQIKILQTLNKKPGIAQVLGYYSAPDGTLLVSKFYNKTLRDFVDSRDTQ